MRLFIAINLPDETKAYINEIQKQIPINDNKFKLVENEQLHLTLKFLGEVSDGNVEKIKSLLEAAKFKSIRAELSSLGVFPSERYIRVVWIGLKPINKIIELQQKIDKSLLMHFKPDKRFHPHVTLARIKSIHNKEEFVKRIKEIKVEKKEFLITDFKLVKSRLTREGPIYEEIGSFGWC